MSKFLDKTGLDTFWAKMKSTFQTLGNLVTSWGSTPSDTKYPSEKLVKDYVDGKSWFKNTSNSGMQNSNAYYQCISAPTTDFSGLVKLYDVTEFFDGTIVNQNERSVFFGDVSLIRDSGNAGCKYARVCAMIGYNTSSSNIILQSDDNNAYPVLVKENFERLEPTYTVGAYVITNNVATLDSTRTRSKFAIISCDGHSSFFINGGFYNPSGYGLSDIKAYIFVDDSFNVLGNASSTNFDGYVDVPSGATKLIVHTNTAYYLSVGPTTDAPKYFLAMRYVAGWPAGTIEYFGRFYTRVTASAAYSARPLLLTYVQNLAPTGTTYIPSGYVVQKTATYTTHSAVSDKLSTARKLAVSLSNTGTDSSFDGSADVTNIKTTGTLGVANGGTGATTANAAANNLLSALPDWTANPTDGVKLIRRDTAGGALFGQVTFLTVWNYIKDKISSVLGLTSSSYGGNAATATKATQDSDGNAINATYFKSSGNTTLVSGSATKIGTQNGADVKLTLPTIPSGSQLVYDCGTGSTSTTDFDNALAAFNAGKWVIINKDSKVYYCVGSYSGPGLRFKQLANEVSLLKVNTLTWTKGSAPTAGTQLEASLSGHTHSQYLPVEGKAASAEKVTWTAGTASTERPVGFANSGNSSSYNQGLDFDDEIVYDKDFTYKPGGSGNGASTLTVKNSKSSSGNEAAVIAKADADGSAVWLNSTATGGSHKRGLWAPASDVSGDSAKWILFNDYVNQRNDSDGWEFIGTSACARYAYHEYSPGSGTAYWIKIGRVTSRASSGSAGGALTAIISSGFNTAGDDLSAQLIRVSIRSKGQSTNGVTIVGDNVTLGLKSVVLNADVRFAVHTVTDRTTSVDGIYDIYVERKGWQYVAVLELHNDDVERTYNSNTTKAISDTTNMTIFSPSLPYAGSAVSATSATSATELRIPYGSGSAYLQIGVSGSYLALGTNMADGVMVSYAGEASQAAVAGMLGTTSVGSANNPIYLNAGVPTACNWWVS